VIYSWIDDPGRPFAHRLTATIGSFTRMLRACRRPLWLAVVMLMLATFATHAATEHYGQVTFNGLPVPGATVTATHDDQKVVTTTTPDGVYRFPNLADGAWSLRVEMIGFAPAMQEIMLPADAMPRMWELSLLPFDEIAKTAVAAPAAPPPQTASSDRPSANGTSARADTPPAGFRRAEVAAAPRSAGAPAAAPGGNPPPPAEPAANQEAASDGLLINGSVNNGAASPFAQPAAFGNNRRRPGSLYTASAGFTGSNSAWDARPYSIGTQPSIRPDYNDLHFVGTFQGILKIPGVVQKRPNVFLGYQRTDDHFATTTLTTVPTALERSGDFSQSVDAFGNSIRIVDPRTGLPFANSAIPSGRISPQAAALLNFYPAPNVDNGGRSNYQSPLLSNTRQDSVQTRVNQGINQRNSLVGTASYQRTTTDSTSLFGFQDQTHASTLDTAVSWTRRFSPFFTLRPRYQFTQQTNQTDPFFAGRTNVSGDAGIFGNDQSPQNWGPPTLSFLSGIASLNDARPDFTQLRTHAAGAEGYLSRGRHYFTIGGDLKHQHVAINAQQDPRGRLTFNGAMSGYDFADFLLGLPQTSSIAFGNADKSFRAWSSDLYITDDLRLTPALTINAGVRWEFEGPMSERENRLVNLDVANGFAAASPVLASNPQGPLTNQRYDASLVKADYRGIQPRTAVAWRPIPGSSVVVRAGYGIYRNTSVYQPIATLLAQQPPLSRTFSIDNTAAHPLSLANPFALAAANGSNTFAVDPDFRVGYAHNWQASLQRDLPASLTVTATYLGTHGSNLIQEFLPNTNPPGAANPCPSCPVGFIYLTSNGHSSRHAGQLQLRRRLRNGLTWTTQYTLSTAKDNATAFTGGVASGASLLNSSVAQDWRNLDAEWGPSSFDQRHNVTAQVEYTTGVGVRGGGLLTGKKAALWKGWTLSSQLTTGSGLPFTPVYLTAVPGTGVIGSVRASLTGAAASDVPAGYYLNPAAYAPPQAGQWGTAGRNSVRGPAQFNLNAAITRSFPWSSNRSWDWRIDATNVLNRVTYSTINTQVGAYLFGLPTTANQMRKIQASLRLRF